MLDIGLPQFLYMALIGLNLGVVSAMHGKPRRDAYNINHTSVGAGVQIALLIWGGFFT